MFGIGRRLSICAMLAFAPFAHGQSMGIEPLSTPVGVSGEYFVLPDALPASLLPGSLVTVGTISVPLELDGATKRLAVRLPGFRYGLQQIALPDGTPLLRVDIVSGFRQLGTQSYLTVVPAETGAERARSDLREALTVVGSGTDGAAEVAKALLSQPTRLQFLLPTLPTLSLPQGQFGVERFSVFPRPPAGVIGGPFTTTDFGSIARVLEATDSYPYTLTVLPVAGRSPIPGSENLVVGVQPQSSVLLPYSRVENQVCGQRLVEIRVTGQESQFQLGSIRERLMVQNFRLDPTYTTYPSQATIAVPVMQLRHMVAGDPPKASREGRAREAYVQTGAFAEDSRTLRRIVEGTGQGITVMVIDTGRPGTDIYRAPLPARYVYPEDSRASVYETKTDGHGAVIHELLSRLVPAARIIHTDACPAGSCGLQNVIFGLCAAAQETAESGRPMVVNLSLHSIVDSVLLKGALEDVTSAGVWVVVSYGNRDAENEGCGKTPEIPCTAYPADWLHLGEAPPFHGRVVSVAGWLNSLGGVRIDRSADYNRAVVSVPPTVSAQGNYWVMYRSEGWLRPYAGTSFAAPVVTAALAMWLSDQCVASIPKSAPQWPQGSSLRLDSMWMQNCR